VLSIRSRLTSLKARQQMRRRLRKHFNEDYIQKNIKNKNFTNAK